MVKPESPADSVNATIAIKFAVVAGKVTKIDVVKQSFSPNNISARAKRTYITAIETALAGYECPGDHPEFNQEFSFRPE